MQFLSKNLAVEMSGGEWFYSGIKNVALRCQKSFFCARYACSVYKKVSQKIRNLKKENMLIVQKELKSLKLL